MSAEKAKKIREELKAAGWNRTKISVRSPHWGSIYVTIKDPEVPIKKVEKIALAYESISRCEITHEILLGGNTYVDVKYADETVERDFGRIPRIRCYIGQLNQVFLNLLVNACDAIGRGGNIRIRTRPTEAGVRLEISDDGPGIPEDVQSRIFDPFFTTKPVGVGTGLGLSLSHSIIERHDGRFWVESIPGEGATFFIELPLDATPPEDET